MDEKEIGKLVKRVPQVQGKRITIYEKN